MPGYRKEARNYIPLFKIFVISSLTEGLPITLLEAMQAKTPVIATRVGGIPEVLDNGRAGILINPCSTEELANAIEVCCRNDASTKKLISTAYQRAISEYSNERMASNYFRIYSDAMTHHA